MVKQHASEIDVPMCDAGCCQDLTTALKLYKELHIEALPMQRMQMHAAYRWVRADGCGQSDLSQKQLHLQIYQVRAGALSHACTPQLPTR